MKKILLSFFVLWLAISANIFPYNVSFTSPSNNQVFVASTSTNTAAVSFGYSVSGMQGGYYYYEKLHTNDNEYSNRLGGSIPTWFYLGGGSYTWTVELYEGDTNANEYLKASQTITFYVKYTIGAANNFGGGSINIEGATVSSGSTVSKLVGESVSVGAIDQNDGNGYDRVWNTNGTGNSGWLRNSSPIGGATPRDYSYSVASNDNGVTLVADLKKVCNATFAKPDGSTVQNVTEGSTGSATAQTYYVSSDWISYSFINWTWSGGSSSNPSLTTPVLYSHATFTANYIGTANASPMGIQFTSTNGNPISLSWNEHPNSNVTQYQVWRYKEGWSPSAIATLSRGTTSYTDYDYIQNPNGDAKLFYTVKAYYSPSGTWNDPGYILNRGDMGAKIANNDASEKLKSVSKEVPSEYSISNYPNPFNPTTVISYQLPKDGFVTLKVYDILGKEVAALVNENKQAGYYNATFNASNLPSGMYIYAIQANGFNQSKKMLLIK